MSDSAPEQAAQPKENMTLEEMRKIYPWIPDPLPRPTRSVECNMMSYTDGQGVKREIWLPKGTMNTACKHMKEKNWDALAKFPAWDNQRYQDDPEEEEKERKTWEWLVAEKPNEQTEKAD